MTGTPLVQRQSMPHKVVKAIIAIKVKIKDVHSSSKTRHTDRDNSKCKNTQVSIKNTTTEAIIQIMERAAPTGGQ